MGTKYSKLFFILAITSLLSPGCSSPLIKTEPGVITDKGNVTITCNAGKGNKGLLNYTGPVYVHVGLITDSSTHPNDWRYVKFKWGSTERAALATPKGKNSWSFTIPNIRKFFEVKEQEKILELAVLFRQGDCVDTACRTLRNIDKTDIHVPVTQNH